MRKISIIILILLTSLTLERKALCQQVLMSEIHFESLQELSTAGAVTTGTLQFIPGVSGNAIDMANSNSVCFPAANTINLAAGTIQFWVKDIVPNKGLYQVTNVGTNKLWGAFRFYDNGGPSIVDLIHYEVQTDIGTFARSSGNWRTDTTWHFLVFTWSKTSTRTSFTIYYDGIKASTPLLFGTLSLQANSMLCLGQYSTWQNSHPKIDELKTFNYIRSQTQINTDFSEFFSGCPLWPFLWRNNINPNDVNHDNIVDVKDAYFVLAAIASGATYNFTVCPNGELPTLSLDVVGDNTLNMIDANAVVSALNATLPPEQQLNINNLINYSHGDIDSNGVLDQSDISYMVNNIGQNVPLFTNGDITGDGLIDRSDIDILRKFASQQSEWRSLLPLFKIVRP